MSEVRHVLIVEDEPLTAQHLAAVVRERGFEVCGPHMREEDAIAALAAGPVHAALLDVSLGEEATTRGIADELARRGVPFAFLTGYGPKTAPIVSAHADRLVIPKPVDAETLGMVLGELL